MKTLLVNTINNLTELNSDEIFSSVPIASGTKTQIQTVYKHVPDVVSFNTSPLGWIPIPYMNLSINKLSKNSFILIEIGINIDAYWESTFNITRNGNIITPLFKERHARAGVIPSSKVDSVSQYRTEVGPTSGGIAMNSYDSDQTSTPFTFRMCVLDTDSCFESGQLNYALTLNNSYSGSYTLATLNGAKDINVSTSSTNLGYEKYLVSSITLTELQY